MGYCNAQFGVAGPSSAGLLLVRGALEPALQRQLIVQAFTCFCEPPNHTNHTRAYPDGLPGIWVAAQQGLRLQLPAAAGQPASQQQVNNRAAEIAGDAAYAPKCPPTSAAGNGCGCGASSPSQPDAAPAAAAAQHTLWGLGGSGPPAASLLGKLRWATLGPPYDWTHRRYLRDVPHTPLPPALRRLAAELASLAAELAVGSGEPSPGGGPASRAGHAGQSAAELGAGSQGAIPTTPQFSPDAALVNFYYEGQAVLARDAAVQYHAFFGTVTPPVLRPPSLASGGVHPAAACPAQMCLHPEPPGPRPACLPCAGDTLNGHIDDAEPSLHQPLVSLSLGCDAVFLIGGPTRDTPPTPLLLRGGDIVVLSGPARHCYHGVPRVLAGAGRPQAAAGCATGSGSCVTGGSGGRQRGCVEPPANSEAQGAREVEFAPFARHMQGCRINISIRDTR